MRQNPARLDLVCHKGDCSTVLPISNFEIVMEGASKRKSGKRSDDQ